MEKMWAGRTAGQVDKIADEYNSSIAIDCRMYREDITGSMAHAAMLGAQKIIPQEAAEHIIEGLEGILNDLESGALEIDYDCEDIHMFVEQVLTSRIGDEGKMLHTARSRNDQVALDLRTGGGALQQGRGTQGRDPSGVYPSAACSAHHLRTSSHGLRLHAPAGSQPSG